MRLATAPRLQQTRLVAPLDHFKTTPFRLGDLQERDSQGRINEILVEDDWLVTFSPDHAVRELRVICLERANE